MQKIEVGESISAFVCVCMYKREDIVHVHIENGSEKSEHIKINSFKNF